MLNPLSLAVATLPRKDMITSTDMRTIMSGAIAELVGHKRHGTEPHLDDVFRVQLGKFTEPFHAGWHVRTNPEVGAAEQIKELRVPNADRGLPAWVGASFDYWLTVAETTLELKHTNERASFREKANYYMGQLQWQMLVTGHPSLRFSLILGNNDPIWGEVEADPVLQEMLIEKAETFRALVASGDPVSDGPADDALAAQAMTVKIDGKRAYDWTKDNAWQASSGKFVLARAMTAKAKKIEADHKALVPADAAEVTGTEVSAKRNKAGSVLWTIDTDASAAAEAKVDALFSSYDEPTTTTKEG